VADAYDMLVADPARAASADDQRARLAAKRTATP
jgi:hypothetical protein